MEETAQYTTLRNDTKIVIKGIVSSTANTFDGRTYRFGRKKPKSKMEAMMYLNTELGIPDDEAMEAIQYMDTLITKKLEVADEYQEADEKPSLDRYVDGGPFPEWLEPVDMATLLFRCFSVAPSGVLLYNKNLGVPKWILRVNPSITPNKKVKEHDIKAGLIQELRRFRKGRSEAEKKANHSISIEEIMSSRDSVTSDIREETIAGIIEEVKYDKTLSKKGLTELDRFIDLYKVPPDNDHTTRIRRLHTVMICHWIWQVKRRLNSLPTVNEICLVFLGRQGIGKSYSARKMTEVILDLATPASVTNLVDERETRRWEKYYIAFLDEISKESKDSLSKLKDWVTRIDAEFRPLHTNHTESCDKNAQAIGTSNFPLASVLKDPTGMRRFWEINSDQEKSKILDGMDNIDWLLIYRSIDESHPYGYYGQMSLGKKYHEEIVNIQNDTRDKSPVEEYLYDHNYVDIHGGIVDTVAKEFMDIGDLRDDFNIWSEQNGWGTYTIKAFRLELKNLHLEMKRSTGNRLKVELNDPTELTNVNEIEPTLDKKVGFND